MSESQQQEGRVIPQWGCARPVQTALKGSSIQLERRWILLSVAKKISSQRGGGFSCWWPGKFPKGQANHFRRLSWASAEQQHQSSSTGSASLAYTEVNAGAFELPSQSHILELKSLLGETNCLTIIFAQIILLRIASLGIQTLYSDFATAFNKINPNLLHWFSQLGFPGDFCPKTMVSLLLCVRIYFISFQYIFRSIFIMKKLQCDLFFIFL